ncbi:MAG TPA: hypothetical protein VKA70_10190 [Blastocatellia bacterium]|nr:hypothetical protein [Blastocatellia bacterium]
MSKDERRDIEEDKALRIGAKHGSDTDADEREGYARDIAPEGTARERGEQARVSGSGLSYTSKQHPSRRLELRSRGYGIGGGYERPYRKEKAKKSDAAEELYGPLPHSGYYGAGEAARPFKTGQATFQNELSWYKKQYGESTSGFEKSKK